jgi:hypothetical protein
MIDHIPVRVFSGEYFKKNYGIPKIIESLLSDKFNLKVVEIDERVKPEKPFFYIYLNGYKYNIEENAERQKKGKTEPKSTKHDKILSWAAIAVGLLAGYGIVRLLVDIADFAIWISK